MYIHTLCLFSFINFEYNKKKKQRENTHTYSRSEKNVVVIFYLFVLGQIGGIKSRSRMSIFYLLSLTCFVSTIVMMKAKFI